MLGLNPCPFCGTEDCVIKAVMLCGFLGFYLFCVLFQIFHGPPIDDGDGGTGGGGTGL